MGKGSTTRERSLSRGSYYPHCRKDAQCECTMCMASIHATLDLRPSNNLFSSLTNYSETPSRGFTSPPSVVKGKENQWPNSEQSNNWPSFASRKDRRRTPPLPLGSTAKSEVELFHSDDSEETMEEKEIRIYKKEKKGHRFSAKFAVVFLILVMEFAVPWCFSGLLKTNFSADKVMGIAQESMARIRLSDRLDFIARKMARVVPGQVDNCTGSESTWKLEQDGLMVHSRCVLYSSILEEVSLWGCPVQTSGVIGRGIVDRSFLVMSGRMIEWYEGKTDSTVHRQGDSWTHAKWTASVVQMDGKTYILEYKFSAMLKGGGVVTHAIHFMKWLICRIYVSAISNFGSFLLPTLSSPHTRGDFRAPT
ncbi:hypothetical protein SUGI_0317460 [Cryptomeria japonica]|nr:hypothetical protein SUGI_0317460 [Cryptomeria japonica]